MAKLKFFLFLIFWGIGAWAFELQCLKISEIPKGDAAGGFSGLAVTEKGFVFVSDDRGRFGKPRVHIFDRELKALGPRFLSGQLPKVLDLEGIAPWGAGWLVISEGDGNSKPRVQPQLLVLDENFGLLQTIDFPKRYHMEPLGKQKSGVRSGYSVEGLTVASDLVIYTALEKGLREDPEGWTRISRWELEGKDFRHREDRFWRLDSAEESGQEFARGVTEILALKDGSLLILERSLQLNKKHGLRFGGRLVRTHWKDLPVQVPQREKIKYEIVWDPLTKNCGEKEFPSANWEGLSVHGDRLWMVSDNNLDSGVPTLLAEFSILW
ncbi:MAG: esterase-like activity of phytase family protein [Bdellovibrionaceae bacterium]|nr:esterase-like activity of phytase family protein [Pseudobdellovibrionaceae bacterium]